MVVMVAPLRVGIAGLGTVGAEVVRLIEQQAQALSARCGRGVSVVAVTARSKAKKRGVDLRGIAWAKSALDAGQRSRHRLLCRIDGRLRRACALGDRDGAEVRQVGGDRQQGADRQARTAAGEVGREAWRRAEFRGGGRRGDPGRSRRLREGLAGTDIDRVYGILNGTCNYILTRMEQEGLSFAECLKDAQRLGYAEANPSFDVDGHDTAQKLAILASLAFGTEVAENAVYVEGISSLTPEDLRAADQLGYRVKLLGVAVRTAKGIEQRVHPTMVRKTSAIAQVMGVTNAVTIDGAGIPPITLVGPGAGGAATASAVVADIADVARGIRAEPFGRPVAQLRATRKAPMERHEGGYYIRLMARDLAGTAATIATRLAQQKISIELIVQRHANGVDANGKAGKGSQVPVILITYATSEDAVYRALKAVQRDKVISGRPQVIRIEKN